MMFRMRSLALPAALAVLTTPGFAGPTLKGWTGPKPEKPPCRCRHTGGKAKLGETICRVRNGRMVTLRCDLVLNNTNWTEIGEGCQLSQSSIAIPFPQRL